MHRRPGHREGQVGWMFRFTAVIYNVVRVRNLQAVTP
jgi:hypothetical protein